MHRVQYHKTKCPICHKKGKLIQNEEETYCECGYVYKTPYPYVAGVKINTDLDFRLKKIIRKKKK